MSRPRKLLLERIVSGGQTGVDRGALDAALALQFPCGGWCPPGRRAEDGRIPQRYPVTELSEGGYRERTLRNVEDSDGTLLIYRGTLTGGSLQTLVFCAQRSKPFQLIDAREIAPRRAAVLTAAFLARHRIRVLNVAGPRASAWPAGAEYTRSVLRAVIGRLRRRSVMR